MLGKPSVLLVDDEEIVLKTIYFDLQEAGYRVDMAESASQALEKLEERFYDLLITDLVMEEMGGLELIEQAKQIRPATMIILLTGYQNWMADLGQRELIDDYLQKPCQLGEVRFRVARCLKNAAIKRELGQLQEKQN